jgi:parallel beta-helix repeat protein
MRGALSYGGFLLLLIICLLVMPAGAQGNGDEPLVITAPGQYVLDHDRTAGGQHGIVISSSDVLLDGNGCQVTGTSISGSVGIVVNGQQQNVTIRNLSVQSWGIGIQYQSVSSGLLSGVTAVNCTENGFLLDRCREISIEDCQALRNGYPGIAVNESIGCRLTGTRALQNGDVGIYLLNATDTRVDHCTVSDNRMNGIFLEQSSGTTIDRCQAAWNRYPGIAISGGTQNLITQNLLYGNHMAAVYLDGTGRTLVQNNAAGGSPTGLSIVNCTDRVVTGGNLWVTDQQEMVIGTGSTSPVPALGPSLDTQYALVALDRAARATVRTGYRVDVEDGRQIALHIAGTGGPVVVMEAGTGDCSLTWSLVQQAVGEFTTAVSVDRAGLGWSDPTTGPVNATADVSDLHIALHNAGLPTPYLLIGEERGATMLRLFAHRYPAEVAGLVLIEPEVENEFVSGDAEYSGVRHQQITEIVQSLEVEEGEADNGYLARNPELIAVDPRLSLQDQQTCRALLASRPVSIQASINEWMRTDRIFTAVQSELKGAHLSPSMPVRVLLSSDPALHAEGSGPVSDGSRTYLDLQRSLAGSSADGRVMVVENTTHSLQLDRPDLVTATVRQLVDQYGSTSI